MSRNMRVARRLFLGWNLVNLPLQKVLSEIKIGNIDAGPVTAVFEVQEAGQSFGNSTSS